ncbi:MAG: branched-chain amino acid transporter permease [Subtercola sp.]|nr:branched-chain amino acid transporter permease [Subtercola sp.]
MLVTLISGLSLGSIYSLVAVGYNLTMLTSLVANFAYAAFIVTGMYLTVFLYSLGLNFGLIFAILIAVGAIVALIEYLVAIRPIQGRGDHAELVTTVGITTVLQGLLYLGTASDAQAVPFFGSNSMIDMFGGGRTSPAELTLIAVAVVVALGAHFWATRTRTGLAALSQSEDRDAALILGVHPARMSFIMFVFSGALGFALAPFVGPVTFAIVSVASVLAIKGFVVLAIGGLGNQLGALMAGLALGIVEALVVRYADVAYQNIAVFGIFIAVLLFRPQGLFGVIRERAV